MNTTSHQSINLPRQSDSLEVHLMGLVDYGAVQFLQERLVYEISGRQDKMGGLLLCEHPPLVTFGREGSRSQLTVSEETLKAHQMEMKWVNRGGGCVVHLPGQLAVYPILPLDRLGVTFADYRFKMEQAVINMCAELKIRARRNGTEEQGSAEKLENGAQTTVQGQGEPGVFCQTGQMAVLGAAIRSKVSFHGMFLNVCPDMELVRWAQMNTIGERLTSLSAQRVQAVSMHSVRESMMRHLAELFGYSKYHVYTGHPLLVRKKKPIYVDA